MIRKIKKGFDMNNKTKKMKKATRKTRWDNFKQWCKKIILFPIRAIKWLWRLICRICRAIWNWLKSIDIVGMINLTLLVAIIVLFLSLISNFVCCKKYTVVSNNDAATTQVADKWAKQKPVDNRRVVKRKYTNATVLPIKVDVADANVVRPQIRTIGVEKPEIVTELATPANELPQQVLGGDVIVERAPNSPILSNGARIDGNLFIQNMRKYTMPCDVKINGHLFIRNVQKVNFCGKFKVNGNVYVNRESSFGPFPEGTKINGQIIL